MAYNYEYPYTDPNRYNSDWAIATVVDVERRQTELEKNVADFETNLTADFEAQRADIQNQINTFTADINQRMSDFTSQTNRDLAAWKTNTENNINNWEQSATTKLNNDFNEYSDRTSAELASDFNDYSAATTTELNNKFKTLSDSLNADYNSFTQSITTQWNNYKTTLNSDWAAYKNGIDADMASLRNDFNVLQSDTNNAVTSLTTQFTALSNSVTALSSKIDDMQSDITTFESNVNSALTSIRSDITDFENDINTKISTQDGKLASMQTQINNFSTQVPTLVNDYLDTLTPAYSKVAFWAITNLGVAEFAYFTTILTTSNLIIDSSIATEINNNGGNAVHETYTDGASLVRLLSTVAANRGTLILHISNAVLTDLATGNPAIINNIYNLLENFSVNGRAIYLLFEIGATSSSRALNVSANNISFTGIDYYGRGIVVNMSHYANHAVEIRTDTTLTTAQQLIVAMHRHDIRSLITPLSEVYHLEHDQSTFSVRVDDVYGGTYRLIMTAGNHLDMQNNGVLPSAYLCGVNSNALKEGNIAMMTIPTVRNSVDNNTFYGYLFSTHATSGSAYIPQNVKMGIESVKAAFRLYIS